MAINSNTPARPAPRTFAQAFPDSAPRQSQNQNQNQNGEDRKKSEFWLNVGVFVDHPTENGETEQRLASLSMGIPLDSIQELPENSSNESYAAFNGIRNDLLFEIQKIAATLKPGEAVPLMLSVELRRKRDDAPIPREQGRRTFNLLGTQEG